jgi:hypothetical protein
MSSKRAVRRRACQGKVRHADYNAANAALRALVRAKGEQGRLQAYRCRFCRGYHFGHVGGLA